MLIWRPCIWIQSQTHYNPEFSPDCAFLSIIYSFTADRYNMNTVEEVKTFSRSLNLLICSWNVGNAPPENIHHLLVGSQYEERGRHDLIVIGLQESTYQTVSEINESFSSNSAAPPNLPPSNRLNNNYAFSEPCILHMTNLIMGALGPEYDIVSYQTKL